MMAGKSFTLYTIFSSLLLLFFINTTTLLAQSSVQISTTVTDRDGEPLIGANVRILNSKGSIVTGGTTNAEGVFYLQANTHGKHKLLITYVGYKNYEMDITLPLKSPLATIILQEDAAVIGSVVVQGKATDMIVKGDTLVFNASAFRTGAGSTLEDLIKRLPGAEVDANGKITINGKQVEKITVDGKEFFAGDPQIATRNLPAEAIDRLELLDKESDQSRMTGFSDGEEETVLNLSLRNTHQQGVFGSSFGGYGLDAPTESKGETGHRYEVGANLSRLSGKDRQTLIIGSNNTNNRGMSEFTPEVMGRRRRNQFGSRGITTSFILAGDVAIDRPLFLLEGNGRYGFSHSQEGSRSNSEVIGGDKESLFTTSDEKVTSNEHTAGFEGRITYKFSEQTEMVARPQIMWSQGKNTGFSSTLSSMNKDLLSSASTNYTNDYTNLRGGGKIDLTHRFGSKGRNITLQMRAYYDGNDEESETESLLSGVTATQKALNNYHQEDAVKQFNSSLALSWVEPLGRSFFLQVRAQWRYTGRNSRRNLFSPDANGDFTIKEEAYSSLLDSYLNTYQGDLNLQKKGDKYNLTVGVSFVPHTMNIVYASGSNENHRASYFNVAPSLRFNFNPTKQTSIRLNYYGRAAMPNAAQMYPTADPTDLLRITKGNIDLKPSFTHMMWGVVRLYEPKSRFAFNLFIRGRYELNGVASNVIFDRTTGQRMIYYQNVNGNASFGVHSSFSLPVINNFFTFSGGLYTNYNHNIGFTDDMRNVSNAVTAAPNLAFGFLKGPIYMKLRGGVEGNFVRNSINKISNRSIWNYSSGFEASYDFLEGLKIETDLRWSTNKLYSGEMGKQEWIWNAALSYSFLKGKKATIRLKAYDLLANATGISRHATAYEITDTYTNVLGRYVMLHFIYRFNSFGGKTPSTPSMMPHRHF